MTLPEITLPQIDLPFAIPEVLQPFIVHFAIALPIIILLIELYNVFTRKRSVGGFSFVLIILMVLVYAALYFVGMSDAKETANVLSSENIKEYKLLATYLFLASFLLLFLKLLATTGKILFKILFFVALIAFVFVVSTQNKSIEGIMSGHNTNAIKILDDTPEANTQGNNSTTDTLSSQSTEATTSKEAKKDIGSNEAEKTVIETVDTDVEMKDKPIKVESLKEETQEKVKDKLIETESLKEKIPVKEHTEVSDIQEKIEDGIPSPKIPSIPSVPKVVEVNPMPKEVNRDSQKLPKFEDSKRSISSDLERLKIETH